jgi:hypothetical protein
VIDIEDCDWGEIFFDVKYVISGTHDLAVPAEFVSRHQESYGRRRKAR